MISCSHLCTSEYIYIYHDVFETAKHNMHTIKFFFYIKYFRFFFFFHIFKIMVFLLFAIRIDGLTKKGVDTICESSSFNIAHIDYTRKHGPITFNAYYVFFFFELDRPI